MSGANAQEGISRGHLFQNVERAVAILNPGAVHPEPDKQSDRVRHDMTLSTLDPLACVVTANPSALGGFHALTIDDAGRRPGLAPIGQTHSRDKLAVHFIQQPVVAPRVEIAPNGRNRREVTGPLCQGSCPLLHFSSISQVGGIGR